MLHVSGSIVQICKGCTSPRCSLLPRLAPQSPLDGLLGLAFGALISATDPVSTLAVLKELSVGPRLYYTVLGESILNDAVAIVLVRILNDLGADAFDQPSAVLLGVGEFLAVSGGSLAVGLASAASSALLLKRVDLSHHAALELSLILLVGYSAYPTAEALQSINAALMAARMPAGLPAGRPPGSPDLHSDDGFWPQTVHISIPAKAFP